MKINWVDFPGYHEFYQKFYILNQCQFPVGILLKFNNGVIVVIGNFCIDGTVSGETEINWPDITHYSTSLVDHLQKEIPELYKK